MYGVSFLERGNTFDDQFYHARKGIQMLLYNKMMPQNQVIELSSTWLLLFVLHFVLQFPAVYLAFPVLFRVSSWTQNRLDACLCVLASVFFVCIWPWHEGAGSFGHGGTSWCQLASGHTVQSHQIAITGRFWLDSDVLTLSLLSQPPIPPFFRDNSSPFVCVCTSRFGLVYW